MLVLSIVLILMLPRRFAVIPFILCAFLLPLGQQLYIGGVHWFVIRLLILAGIFRLLLTKADKTPARSRFIGGFTSIDKAFLICVAAQVVGFILLYQQKEATVNKMGFFIDFAGGYFLIRLFIRSAEDIYRVVRVLAVVSFVLAIGMVIEQVKLINVFGMMGGTNLIPAIREGKIRSQGVFQHALPAGTVAATWIPLFALLWRNGKSKLIALIGLISATIMTVTSQSSTPLLAYAASLLALLFWKMRENMRAVRWGIVIGILLLAVVMKAPVWYVIAHIDLTGGSSGYHRAELVNQFIMHFWDWWLIGVKDASTWGYDLWDVQNQYVDVGETGGLLAFCYFVALISRSFARLGDARKKIVGDKDREWLFWLIGSALFSNALAFIGVNYFDQSRYSWFLILSFICTATAPVLETAKVEQVGGVTQISQLKQSKTVDVQNNPIPARRSSSNLADRFLLDRTRRANAVDETHGFAFRKRSSQ